MTLTLFKTEEIVTVTVSKAERVNLMAALLLGQHTCESDAVICSKYAQPAVAAELRTRAADMMALYEKIRDAAKD